MDTLGTLCFAPRLSPVPTSALLTELLRAATLLGAVALVAIGASGLIAELFGYALWRRGRREPRYLGVLPDGFAATVATALYGVAAAGLLLQSLNGYVFGHGVGNGQWLSGAIVSLAMAAVYAVSLYRTLLARGDLAPT